jgi:hypothetical protein
MRETRQESASRCRFPIHLATPSHQTVVREGPKPTRPSGRVPRVSRILALAHHFQHLIDTGVVRPQPRTDRAASMEDVDCTAVPG